MSFVSRHPRSLALVAGLAAVAVAVPLVASSPAPRDAEVSAAPANPPASTPVTCPDGYLSLDEYAAQERALRNTTVMQDQASDLRRVANEVIAASDTTTLDGCIAEKHPERLVELMARSQDYAAARVAPYGSYSPAAFGAAVAETRALEGRAVDGGGGRASQYGKGPLIVDDERFGVSQLGLVDNAGRVDDLEYVPGVGMFAAVGTGGVWFSPETGVIDGVEGLLDRWFNLGDSLPTTVTGSLAWTESDGGSLVVLTGDPTFGGIAGVTGDGVYRTDDVLPALEDGAIDADELTWERSDGVPSGALGFKVAVDKTNQDRVYAATMLGLFRSTDGGRTFANVDLPVGEVADGIDCTGVTDIQATQECTFANTVTDVVVQEPGGTTDVTEPAVVAAVGWRGGNLVNPAGEGSDEFVQAPGNGIYKSTTGEPGSFTKTNVGAPDDQFTPQRRIGRIELGPATGATQSHEYLYAIVQDSQVLNGTDCATIDAPDPSLCPSVPNPALGGALEVGSVLNGVFVSDDFGESWVRMADESTFINPANGSALSVVGAAVGFQPGIQAWYNLWIAPDPTLNAPGTDVPGRVALGLEEVWENETPGQAMNGPTNFKVIGRYFGGETCQLLALGVPVCPTNRPSGTEFQPNTTHPDQHVGLFVQTGEAEVALIVGNDGGVYQQRIGLGASNDFDNAGWGEGDNDGFQTLLPYDVAPARDGRAWFGLQDNGSGYVDPTDGFKQFETFGGDGFFVATDPFNSDIAYYETPGATMNVTQDGGLTSGGMSPPAFGGPYRFSNPFVMDPNDAKHLATAGTRVYESAFGPGTSTPANDPQAEDAASNAASDWREVFDLGTRDKPGQPGVAASAEDPDNTMSAIDTERNATYVGFCGVCDIINSGNPFRNGIATNVAGDEPQQALSSDGWHIAAAKGLPNRFITSVAIHAEDPREVYVTLGGYSRRWLGPGRANDGNDEVGEGHLYKSVDGGETFVDWSGNLPDAIANWVELRGDQILVGTDVGGFVSAIDGSADFQLMDGLPPVPVATIEMQPGNPNRALVATFGRGVWTYDFTTKLPKLRVDRIAGGDRVTTSVEVSRDQYDEADTVVVATSQVYADALSVAPLAWQEDAPILLTDPASLRPEVAAEIDRLGAQDVIIAGGDVALAPEVERQLEALGLGTRRFAGGDRFETAGLFAAELPNTGTAYLVEGQDADPGRGWPDALAVGPLAATLGHPVLLTTTEELPGNTATALDALGTEEVVVVGGPVAVSEDVEKSVAAREIETRRLAGGTRYETSTLIADEGLAARLTDFRVFLSRADFWADALSAGATVGRNGGVLLLVPPTDLAQGPETVAWVREHSERIAELRFLGGPLAIAENVPNDLARELAKGPIPTPPAPPLKGEDLVAFSFDGDDGGFTPGGSGTGQWQFNATQWQVVPYTDETTATLLSPPIPFEGGSVQFDASVKWNTEECCDFFSAEWSDDGENFTQLFNYDAMNPSYPAYDTETHTFVAEPGEIFIRFKMSSDALVFAEGAYVESVTLTK